MKSYTKIRRIGHRRNSNILKDGKLLLKEKLDGANFRAKVIETERGPEWVFGSNNVEYKDEDGVPQYDENVDGRFTDAINYVRERINPGYVKENYGTKYTFFMENMVQHSLDYNWEQVPQVIGFDIYDHENNSYLATPAAYTIFEDLSIETAPLVNDEDLDATEFDPEEYEIPESNYRDGKMEGVVIINTEQEEDNRSGFSTRAKMVTEEFAEKHKKATGAKQSKEAVHGHEKIISKYCTDARIRKTIEKMRDEGRPLGMELMENQDSSEGLPMRVAVDILEEEAENIVRRNDKMKWKDYRSLISKRCVHVLRQEIQRNA
jgi:hypothetical protein